MKRIVLALLALLGLVAQSAPVHARLCAAGSEQIGAINAPHAQRQALTVQAAPSVAATPRPDRGSRDCVVQSSERKRPVYIPSVQLGIDRAHE